MKLSTISLVTSLFLVGSEIQSFSQGFVNLNFETPTASLDFIGPGTTINSSGVFNGWTPLYTNAKGITQANSVMYDGYSIGGNLISIMEANQLSPTYFSIEGRYSAALFGGVNNLGDLTSASLTQSGLIPAGTKSILMDVSLTTLPAGTATFSVNLDGQMITMVPLAVFSKYTLYGGDVSTFAGRTSSLSISSPASGPIPNGVIFDDVRFSASSVPEPGLCSFFLLGAASLMGWRRIQKGKNSGLA